MAVSEEKKARIKEFSIEALPVLTQFSELMKKHGIEKMGSFYIGGDGYFDMDFWQEGIEVSRSNFDSEPKIKITEDLVDGSKNSQMENS